MKKFRITQAGALRLSVEPDAVPNGPAVWLEAVDGPVEWARTFSVPAFAVFLQSGEGPILCPGLIRHQRIGERPTFYKVGSDGGEVIEVEGADLGALASAWRVWWAAFQEVEKFETGRAYRDWAFAEEFEGKPL